MNIVLPYLCFFEEKGQHYTTGKVLQCLFNIDLYSACKESSVQ